MVKQTFNAVGNKWSDRQMTFQIASNEKVLSTYDKNKTNIEIPFVENLFEKKEVTECFEVRKIRKKRIPKLVSSGEV